MLIENGTLEKIDERGASKLLKNFKKNVFGFKLSGTWWDIGTLQAYTRIQEAFKAYYDTS